MNEIETLLSQKLARQQLLQSQERALNDELTLITDELETLEDEIEQLEEELQKQEDVQTDARFDELIKDLNDDGMTEEEYKESLGNDAGKYDKVLDSMMGNPLDNMMGNPLAQLDNLIPQRQPKAWSHADDENDDSR